MSVRKDCWCTVGYGLRASFIKRSTTLVSLSKAHNEGAYSEVVSHLWPILLSWWWPALVGVVLRGWRVIVRIGCWGRRRCVEGCGLMPAAKLLRGRLILNMNRLL